MASILKVNTIQDTDGNNIINENANVITIGASGDTITVPAGATVSGFTSAGIDDNATSVAITIDSNENVGIGTTSPSSLLHIFSSAPKLIIQDGGTHGTNSAPRLEFKDGSSIQGFVEFADDGTMRIDQLKANPLTILTNNVERMRIDSSGNVGIGTSAPLRDLVVSNNGAEGYEFGPGETSDINQTLHYNRSSSAYIAHWQRASYHRFDTPTTEAMRLTSTGLGIGTSSPSAKLDVVDSSNSVQMVIRGRSSDNFGILQFKNNAGSASKGEIKSDASNNLIFRAGASTDDLTILENGNIGIGQSTPSQKLDVVGNAEINGNIYNNGKLNIRKDGASESEHLVITNETAGSNASPTFTDLHFNGYSGKDRGRIRVQDQSNNKVGGFMKIQTAGSESTDGSGFETRIFLDNDGDIFFYEDTGTTAKVKWDATNERFGIGTIAPTEALDVSGTVKATGFDGSTPMVYAEGNSGTSCADNTTTKITLDNELIDTEGLFANSRFTVTSGYEGKYLIIWQLSFNHTALAKTVIGTIKVNGNTIAYGQDHAAKSSNHTMIVRTSIIRNLTTNDYLEFFGRHDTGSTKTSNGGIYTNVQITKLID